VSFDAKLKRVIGSGHGGDLFEMGKGPRVKYFERPVWLTGDIPLAQIIHKTAASAADGPDRQFQRLV
jgi:hypothetical protein